MNGNAYIILPSLMMMALACGILLIGIILYSYIYYYDRQRLFASISMLGLAGLVFIISESLVISLGVSGLPAMGMQFHRIQALSAAFYIFALPFFVFSLLETTPLLQKITRLIYLAGFTIFLCFVLLSFVKPDLFLSLSRQPHLLATPWNPGRGTPGALYIVRDIFIFLISCYSIALLVYEFFIKKRGAHLLLILIGSFFGLGSGIVDLALARQEMGQGLFSIRVFSYFGFGMAVFIIFAMLGIMKKYIDQTKEIEKSRKIESLGVMAGGIAHDFNNILTGILGNASLLGGSAGLAVKQTKMIYEIEKAATRAKKLSAQLLTFARGGSPVKNIASLRDLVSETVEFVLRGSNISVDFSFPDNLLHVHVDESQISQVIQNIILNAREAMPGGGCIEVYASNTSISGKSGPLDEGDYVTLNIRDNGCGIPGNVLPQIFDPYFSTKKTGSGLGLAICWSIITKHGGLITVKSRPGEGSLFSIHLPSVRGRTGLEQRVAAAPRVLKGRVLFMDDDASIRTLFAQMLKKMGLDFEIAEDGESAVKEYLKAHADGCPYDLVILDLTVPGSMGGKEALSEIRKTDPSVRAVLISGYAEDDSMADSNSCGCDSFIQKPFSYDEIHTAISKVLGDIRHTV